MLKTYFKRSTVRGFDKWSETYEADVVPKLIKRGYCYTRLAKIIIDYLKPKEGDTVIEVGVGSGVLGKEIKLIRPDLELIGLDISFEMLLKAREKKVYDQLYQCDANEIPIVAGASSCLYSAFMLHSAYDLQLCLSEFKRVCHTGSRIAVIDLFKSAKTRGLLTKFKDNLHSMKYEHGALANYASLEEVKALAPQAGMKISQTTRLDESEIIVQQSAGTRLHALLGLEVV